MQHLKDAIKRICCTVITIILMAANTIPVYATVADYYDNGFFSFNGTYINRLAQPIPNVVKRGIDVSFYQGDINWKTVSENDVSFAFIRCGSYKLGPDYKFDYNMSEAKKYGIKRGIYIASIATTPEFAEMEAYYVLHCARQTSPEYPLVIDMEGAQAELTNDMRTKIATRFCEVIKSAGYTPMVYTSYHWFLTKFNENNFNKWVAQYDDICALQEEKWFWQCTSHGYIPGIEGRVDIDFEYDIADPMGIKADPKEYSAEVPDTIKYTNSEKIENNKAQSGIDSSSSSTSKIKRKNSFNVEELESTNYKYDDEAEYDSSQQKKVKDGKPLEDGTRIEVNELTEENGWKKK